MKNISFIFLMLIYSGICNAQCVADAGSEIHVCSDPDSLTQLGGMPAAYGGNAPYTYEWWIEPIPSISEVLPFIYASNLLSDTSIANPTFLYNGSSFSDSLEFFLRITDSSGCQSLDTLILTRSLFNMTLMSYEAQINQGDSVYLNQGSNIDGGFGNVTYSWSPTEGLSDTTLANGFWAKPDETTHYTPTITDTKGCQFTAGPFYYIYVNSVGLEEFNQIPVSLYPNPTSGVVYFESKQQKPIEKMELFSITGSKLTTQLNPENRIDLSDYEMGAYILKLYFDEGIVVKKIVKE